MNVIWISLRGNMNSCGSCTCKVVSDVATLPQKMVAPKTSPDDIQELNVDHHPPKFRHHYNRNRFLELGMGEPSRKVIEMIFRGASSRRNPRRKIKRVIKVNNPVEILGKFEKYRERVMISSSSEHPRSIVDGNETLQFYGTTINCCNKNNSLLISELCRDATCRACTLIQSGFNTSYNKLNGIRLSTNSDKMSEHLHLPKKAAAKKAVIICRTIAGGTGMDNGRFLQDNCQDGLICTKTDESIVLRNPAAVLPCFVIVF